MTSLRRRLLVGVGVGVALALAVSGVTVHVLAKRALFAQFDDALVAKARALSSLVEQEHGVVEFDDLSRATPPGEYFELRTGDRVLVRSTSLGARSIDTVRDVRRTEVAFTPRSEDLEGPRTATLAYARSTAEVDATIAQLRTILLGVGAGALALLLVVLAWIARVGLRPVHALGADIAAVDASQLQPINGDRPRELAPIVERLNELLGRVGHAMARERSLTAEVAHELRTPLAGLRATIELALDRDRAPERYREALAQCLAITKQTERMVESMLSLAKLDAGMIPVDAKPVELDGLVRDVLATHAAQIAERELAVATHLEAATVRSDPTKLLIIVHNLLDNAVAYANTRGTITVDVEPATIRISNTGCTLADTTHVFERFWRGDAARTAGTHAGLGLSICKKLVELIGGTITARVTDGRFIATVTLPATSETNADRSSSAA